MTKNFSTENIPDLTGKVIIVTGANSGIGYEATKEFARKGAQIILACRSMKKAEVAHAELLTEIPDAAVEIMQLDLASLASVHKFVEVFKTKYKHLDILLNNAGIMMVPYGKTEDGFELQFGTNHLGHFALTGLLIDRIRNTMGARVVNISSNGHRMGKMDFENLLFDFGEGYSPTRAYGLSKLANLLFTYEIQRRFENFQINAMAAAHPGGSNTNLFTHLNDRWYIKPLMPLVEKMMQSAAMGALPSIRAAIDPQLCGGEYYGPGGFMEQGGYPILVQSNHASHIESDARRLWEVSEKLTGVSFLN